MPVLDDVVDDGGETLTLTLSNASGAWVEERGRRRARSRTPIPCSGHGWRGSGGRLAPMSPMPSVTGYGVGP